VNEKESKDYSPVGDRSLNFFCHFSNSAFAFFCSLVGPNHPELGGKGKGREKDNDSASYSGK
jgi:hypothetical protein